MSEDDYSLSFFDERTAWPMVHIVNPFMHYMIFQNTTATIVLFCLWESFERIMIIVCAGKYCIFNEEEESEVMSDSVIGDILQGLIGVLLAKTFVVALHVPRWNLGFRRSYRKGVGRVWVKRVLQFFFFGLGFAIVNMRYLTEKKEFHGGTSVFDYESSIRVGVIVAMLYHLVYFAVYSQVNKSKIERRLFWNPTAPDCDGRAHAPHRFPRYRYTRIFVAWMLTVLFLESSVVYNATSHYVQAWSHAFVVLIVLSVIAWKGGRIGKMADLFTCGCYSVKTRDYHDNSMFVEHNPHFEDYSPQDVDARIQ